MTDFNENRAETTGESFGSLPSSRHNSPDNNRGSGRNNGSTRAMKPQVEPIAIVGIGCRFPGQAETWQAFWQMLCQGADAITETPAERWNLQKFYAADAAIPSNTGTDTSANAPPPLEKNLPGKTQSKWGGYVEGIDRFDPQLFGISPREAANMDPQQRMLLEVAFRAFEDAGQPLEKIAGLPVSVFVGISSFDYAVSSLSNQDRGVINAYSNTGGSSSIAANRISYCFDLRGPSVAVDTACSSSLVALHMACESIWHGDASMALAGGVNALLLPDFYVAFSQLGVLSPDGRCKTFDADANGYVRSEGAGMVLLKPLSQALADGDPVYAVVRSTELNQDGRTPGMTVPSQAAQEALIQRACEKAQVHPRDIQYVEAHGTGTPVGDPIEAAAIGSQIGRGRAKSNPCRVGSVKTNIGHLEAGAGMASLIKTALALHHRKIPGNLNFQIANPAIDLPTLGLRVPVETEDWEADGGSRIAGVNGFGYGGANAHVILEEAPDECRARMVSKYGNAPGLEKTAGAESGLSAAVPPSPMQDKTNSIPTLITVSGRSRAALRQRSLELADWIENAGKEFQLAEVGGFLAHRCSHHEYRATICSSTHQEAATDLRAAVDAADTNSAASTIAKSNPKLAFVCSGQGPQWWAMGRELLSFSPIFRESIEKCDVEFSRLGDWSLLEELQKDESTSRMQETSIAQPSIFAIQVALAAVWNSWGVEPDVIVGHSVGEIAAAYLSGALRWKDACLVAFHRGRTMDLASSHGAMLAVGLSETEVRERMAGFENQVSIAAINSPSSLTLSGSSGCISLMAKRFENNGIFCRRLSVEYAFHSSQMDPVREELLRCLSTIQPQKSRSKLLSTVTGSEIAGTEMDANYWWRNVRESVRFADAMQQAVSLDVDIAVEIGPHPVLAYSIDECSRTSNRSIRSVPSLNRKQRDLECMSRSLGELYRAGVPVKWEEFYTRPQRMLPVPIYPFQRQRCWAESFESQYSRQAAPAHPLLGERQVAPEPSWEQRIDLQLQDYLADHRVRETAVYPAAAIIETGLAAARELRTDADNSTSEPVSFSRFELLSPCGLSHESAHRFQTEYSSATRQLKVSQRESHEDTWHDLAKLKIVSGSGFTDAVNDNFRQITDDIRLRCTDSFDGDRLYAYCEQIGLFYGDRFRSVTKGIRRDCEALVEVTLPSSVRHPSSNSTDNTANQSTDTGPHTYCIHPVLLDGCFHGMIAADFNFDHVADGLYLPATIQSLRFWRSPGTTAIAHIQLRSKSHKAMLCDIDIYSQDGHHCASLMGFESRRVSGGPTAETRADLIYGNNWKELPLASTSESITTRQSLSSEQSYTPENYSPENTQAESLAVKSAAWIVLLDRSEKARPIVDRLKAAGKQVIEVLLDSNSDEPPTSNNSIRLNPADKEGLTNELVRLTAAPEANTPQANTPQANIEGILFAWPFDIRDENVDSTEAMDASTKLTALAPMHLVQAWDAIETALKTRLVILTAGGQAFEDIAASQTKRIPNVSQAALIGFGRVIVSEIAKFSTKLIDLPLEPAPEDWSTLAAEITAWDEEDEVLISQGHRYVQRFDTLANYPLNHRQIASLPCRLQLGKSAGIGELVYRTELPRVLDSDEVEIRVHAAGLNFSDVMKGLDLYPGLPIGPVELGAECSGVVTRTGSNADWQIGDEVIAVAPGAFATHVIVKGALVAKKPSTLTHQQAAAIPIAFLTAQYAIHECARLRKGDSILIHSASGGVGLAAMQIAKNYGIEVFATAGTEQKRDFVRQTGATEVFDSRTLAFSKQILDFTKRRGDERPGVDAVLNSLPGEAIPAGLATLKTAGRFLEIGKRDIYDDAALGMAPLRNNLAFFAIDLDQLFKQQPQRMGTMLRELSECFESGELKPMPVTTFGCDETQTAFRFMQQGKHIGKIVVDLEDSPSEVLPGEFPAVEFRSDATYWIAGGLGGFGLQVACWLVEHGAKHLVLSGRSQQLRAGVSETLEKLRQAGTEVIVLPADITKMEDVRYVIETIRQEHPPLSGIFHTAMVLEDRLLVDLDRDTLERVLRPKLLGGWNLHIASGSLELDHFVLFSSLSSIFGHAGQANYSAANAALDTLAHHRVAKGLPATVINWGHLGEVGYLAERESLGQRLERQGVLSFTVQQALECLEYALQSNSVQFSVLRIDWSLWRGLGVTQRVSPRFRHLLRTAHGNDNTVASLVTNVTALKLMPEEQRSVAIESMLGQKISTLLGIEAKDLQPERPLLEMGLDSLMAVELRNWLENALQLTVPISSLMRNANLRQLSVDLSGLLSNVETPNDAAESHQKTIANSAATELSSDQDATPEPSPATEVSDSETQPSPLQAMVEEAAESIDAKALLQDLPSMGTKEVSRLLNHFLKGR